MTYLTVVRHGETEWNATGLQQGHLDSPLNKRGIKQAVALAFGLRERTFDCLYSSDLGRAMQTTEIVNDLLNLPVTVEPGLRERHLGIMQGLTIPQFREQFPDQYRLFSSGDETYALESGESRIERTQRHLKTLSTIAATHPDKRIVIITHSGVLDSLFRTTFGLSLTSKRTWACINASINVFSWRDDHFFLEEWGATNHLGDIPACDDF